MNKRVIVSIIFNSSIVIGAFLGFILHEYFLGSVFLAFSAGGFMSAIISR